MDRRVASFPGAIRSGSILQQTLALDKADHLIETLLAGQIGHHERAFAAHGLRITLHDLQRGTDERGQIDLVDHQQIRTGDAGSPLPRDFLATGDIDHIDGQVDQFGRERGRQIVAARFDEDDVGFRIDRSWRRRRAHQFGMSFGGGNADDGRAPRGQGLCRADGGAGADEAAGQTGGYRGGDRS